MYSSIFSLYSLYKARRLQYYIYMIFFLLGLVLAFIALVLWVLYKTYEHVPPKEMKRAARHGDPVAALLYKPVAYGVSLQVLLASLTAISIALALACLVHAVGVWLAVLLLLIIAGVGGFVLVPTSELTHSSLWLAKRAAPVLTWFLEHLNPIFDLVARFVRKHRPLHIHTGLYEREDLVDLLVKQQAQDDNRIAPGEIALLKHALTFGDKLVSDALVPKRVVKLVGAGEAIGPVLMDELAASGHSRFPVYDGKRDNIVGILYLHELVGKKSGGKVSDVMSAKLTYVHEDFTLYQTLQAFLKTKHHLFLVVNSFEEFVGIITIEDVLEQMIGKLIVDEFDKYDDLRAVAAAAAKKEHVEHQKAKTEPEATTEASEVIK
jgi:CBS domain containing-hemolysin-like protein